MITVHHLENSRSQRILWLLEELGLQYEITKYDLDANVKRSLDFMESSLNRSVWFCGDELTAADIQMSFAVEAASVRTNLQDGTRKRRALRVAGCEHEVIDRHEMAGTAQHDQDMKCRVAKRDFLDAVDQCPDRV